jgi:hypothetical protein
MRRVISIAGVSIAAAIGALSLRCAMEPRPLSTPAAREYPGTLVPPSTVPGEFLARQEVKARYGGTRVRFKSVLQKRGDTLTLLGLTPFGTRAFLLQQEGTAVTFTSYVDRGLPFPPRYILFDIQRALFIGITSGPLADGMHTASREGEEIRERWKGGRIMERTFRRETGQPPGSITITCKDGMVFGVPPPKLKFRNEWFGYDLTITTRSYESLEPRGKPADDER